MVSSYDIVGSLCVSIWDHLIAKHIQETETFEYRPENVLIDICSLNVPKFLLDI